jgi:hypothetical protein
MARPRKATATLELNGAFAKDPQRRRVDPPTGGPLGDPPTSLPEHMHALWYELADEAPIGVLTKADRSNFAEFVKLKYYVTMTEHELVAAADRSLLHAMHQQFGMTPASRSKVHAPKQEEDNPFGKFAAKVKQARSGREKLQ